ncbi:MAG: DNA-binding response regulator [Burkholderiaceae bacterium]
MSTIIVIEPHTLLRLGIVDLLSRAQTFRQVEGVDLSRLAQDRHDPRPCDLVVLSVSTTDDIARFVPAADRAFSPKAILLLSDSPTEIGSPDHLPSIVAGCVSKGALPEIVDASVRVILAGGTCFPPRTVRKAAEDPITSAPMAKWPPAPHSLNGSAATLDDGYRRYADMAKETPGTPSNGTTADPRALSLITHENAPKEWELLGLTKRQYEVLVLLARGYPMKTVGRYLNISVATAKAHTETLYQRLDVHNRNAAVFAAVSKGPTLGWPSITKAQEALDS